MHRFEERCMMKLKQTYEVTDVQRDLFRTIQKLQMTVRDQKFKIENKNNCDDRGTPF